MCLGVAFSNPYRVKNAYFKVKLIQTLALPLTALRDVLTAKGDQLATSLEPVNRIMQCIDVIYKNHMNKVMVSSGRSPRMFHLTEDQHVTDADRDRNYTNPVIGENLKRIFYQVRDRFRNVRCFSASLDLTHNHCYYLFIYLRSLHY